MIMTRYYAIQALVGGELSGSDDGSKMNYIDGQTPPSESEIIAKLAELQAAEPIRLLRERRDWLLAETDWMANKDVTLTTAWKTYRQALRDLPSGLDTVEKVNAVTWPTKPE